jgi:hypothetical protein
MKGYTGYKLTDDAQAYLLARVPAVHPDVIAHHVTYAFGVEDDQMPADAGIVRVVAVAHNKKVQAAIVKVNGSVMRPDGSYFHITVSIDRAAGGRPVDSNALVRDRKRWVVRRPFILNVVPQFFPFGA